MSQNTSALTEVLNNWKAAVLDVDNPADPLAATASSKSNEDLQKDAQTFFRYISSNTQIDTGSGVVLQTKSSHEEALARLIQELGPPAFTSSSHPRRLRGLYVLWGAIEGCAVLSNACLKSLGDFLLLHCGPIADEDDELIVEGERVQGIGQVLREGVPDVDSVLVVIGDESH